MVPPAKTPTDQVNGINKLVEDALDSLQQVTVALQTLKERLTAMEVSKGTVREADANRGA